MEADFVAFLACEIRNLERKDQEALEKALRDTDVIKWDIHDFKQVYVLMDDHHSLITTKEDLAVNLTRIRSTVCDLQVPLTPDVASPISSRTPNPLLGSSPPPSYQIWTMSIIPSMSQLHQV